MTKQAEVNPSEETIQIGPLGIRFLLTGKDTNGSVSVFEVSVPAGKKLAAPAHKNDAYEETLYGITGTVTWTIDGKAIAVGPGQAVCIRRGAVHRFDNFGTEDAKPLSIVPPPIMGRPTSGKQALLYKQQSVDRWMRPGWSISSGDTG